MEIPCYRSDDLAIPTNFLNHIQPQSTADCLFVVNDLIHLDMRPVESSGEFMAWVHSIGVQHQGMTIWGPPTPVFHVQHRSRLVSHPSGLMYQRWYLRRQYYSIHPRDWHRSRKFPLPCPQYCTHLMPPIPAAQCIGATNPSPAPAPPLSLLPIHWLLPLTGEQYAATPRYRSSAWLASVDTVTPTMNVSVSSWSGLSWHGH